ncbi:MAG TPA: Crp/Fnr family transcriptional regulator, partial [Candidatus Kapabacteria bacterium]|nr:Crp/Fnr family transcriptional regulator [Candidatus Kapabacteria bacterium]
MSSPHHKASAIIEEHTTLAIVQAHDIRHLLSQSAQARDFIFALLAHRLADVVTLIDEIVFSKMDKRLAHFLLNNTSAHNTIHATHEHIAIELGTAREVISRLLKDFESKGYIALNRGSITIIKDTQLLMY